MIAESAETQSSQFRPEAELPDRAGRPSVTDGQVTAQETLEETGYIEVLDVYVGALYNGRVQPPRIPQEGYRGERVGMFAKLWVEPPPGEDYAWFNSSSYLRGRCGTLISFRESVGYYHGLSRGTWYMALNPAYGHAIPAGASTCDDYQSDFDLTTRYGEQVIDNDDGRMFDVRFGVPPGGVDVVQTVGSGTDAVNPTATQNDPVNSATGAY